MPQFDYYGTWDDSVAVLRCLFEYDSIRVVHDSGIWREPSPHYFQSVTDELLHLLRQRPFLFIYGQFSSFLLGLFFEMPGLMQELTVSPLMKEGQVWRWDYLCVGRRMRRSSLDPVSVSN